MTVTIWHNPDCGTSRNALALLRASGSDPVVIDVLRDPPSRATVRALVAAAGLTVREALRERGTPFAALGLDDPALDEEALLDAIAAHPILLNRPFVETPRGTRLCRPSERVLDLLENPAAVATKEGGAVVRGLARG